jgi:DNA-binding SARP family transcriptional activator/TolB-like protein/Tfp pilus assembly protein PilF
MSGFGLQLRLLGPASVIRDDVPLRLPRSRKVLALLAYLTLEGTAQSRTRLCDLFWDGPSDPKAELRWCLSKLRSLVDQEDGPRVVTTPEGLVELNLSEVTVDVYQVEALLKLGMAAAATGTLSQALAVCRGELLEGVEVDGSPELAAWLAARRQRYRAARVAIASELAVRPSDSSDEAWRRLHGWLEVAPFELRAHQALLEALLKAGRLREAEDHVAAAIRSLEQEGLDWLTLRSFWHEARQRTVSAPAEPTRTLSVSAPAPPPSATPAESRSRLRASVAIMPFVDGTAQPGPFSELAHGLTDDIITRLAKLRALFVIARGTSYALADRGIGAEEAGRILGVEYVASGRVRRRAERISVIVELADTRDARIVWTDELVCNGDATFDALDAIVNRVVACIAEEIETAESHRAMLRPPCSLDAWEQYHRGLWHMYKFTGQDNQDAERLFRAALALDPTFARAHSGLSFTHFQNVFLDLAPDRERQIQLAFETAEQSLSNEDRDPAAHWAMGRALWLRGANEEAVCELERSIELSPNFALGHYTLGFVEAQSGDPRLAIAATNTSRELSPFDPLQFGMLASRALAHMRLGELDEAAEWALKAIGRPNAHAHILAIAASSLSLVKRYSQARKLVLQIRERIPAYSIEHFVRAFRLDRETEQLLRLSALRIDFAG